MLSSLRICALLCIVAGCSEYDLKQETIVEDRGDTAAVPVADDDTTEPPADPSSPVDDTARPVDTGEPADADTGGGALPEPEEECNGVDDDGDGDIDEAFDANGNGIADCLEEESYCTPFDTFEDWSYAGTGDWHVESGMLTEGRSGFYDAIAWLYDLGAANHFAIEVSLAWTGSLNDLAGIAWGVNETDAFVVRWDDPQGDYGRYTPTGRIDLSYCSAGACTELASSSTADLYRVADQTFSTMAVDVNGDQVTVSVDGVVVMTATESTVLGSGPGVVGLYSNDNDGGVWFDDFCVWTELD